MSTVTDEVAMAVLAQNLKAALDARDMSQRELSRSTGDPIMTINDIVNAKSLPRIGVVVRIADALGLSIDELFEARKKSPASSID